MNENNLLQLSVVIPAWNERENLELLLPALAGVIADLGIRAEVLVVDGGSHDGTAEASARLGARVIRQKERGYGGAVLAGLEAAAAPYVATMDADLSHTPEFLAAMWRQRDEAEVLIASRYIPGGAAEMSAFRRLLSRILNVVYGVLLALPVKDLSSGFRLYRRGVVARLAPRARDFDFLEEILIEAYHNGARVREIPFHYKPRVSGHSHAKLIRFGWAYLKTLARMWRLRRQGPAAG